jgi:hypothetical protein
MTDEKKKNTSVITEKGYYIKAVRNNNKVRYADITSDINLYGDDPQTDIGSYTKSISYHPPTWLESVNSIHAQANNDVPLGSLVNSINARSGDVVIENLVKSVGGFPPDSYGNVLVSGANYAIIGRDPTAEMVGYTTVKNYIITLGDLQTSLYNDINYTEVNSGLDLDLRFGQVNHLNFYYFTSNSYRGFNCLCFSSSGGEYHLKAGNRYLTSKFFNFGLDLNGVSTDSTGLYSLDDIHLGNSWDVYTATQPIINASGNVIVILNDQISVDMTLARYVEGVPFFNASSGAKIVVNISGSLFPTGNASCTVAQVQGGGKIFLKSMPNNTSAANFRNIDNTGMIKVGNTIVK